MKGFAVSETLQSIGCVIGSLLFLGWLPFLLVFGVYLNLKALAETNAKRRAEKANQECSNESDWPPPPHIPAD